MDDLVKFIQDRSDETEAAALAWGRGPWEVRGGYDVFVPGTQTGHIAGAHEASVASHIARHDPDRTLREVASVRAVVAAYQDAIARHAAEADWLAIGNPDEDVVYVRMRATAEALEMVCRQIAAIDSDHPEYRETWKP